MSIRTMSHSSWNWDDGFSEVNYMNVNWVKGCSISVTWNKMYPRIFWSVDMALLTLQWHGNFFLSEYEHWPSRQSQSGRFVNQISAVTFHWVGKQPYSIIIPIIVKVRRKGAACNPCIGRHVLHVTKVQVCKVCCTAILQSISLVLMKNILPMHSRSIHSTRDANKVKICPKTRFDLFPS